MRTNFGKTIKEYRTLASWSDIGCDYDRRKKALVPSKEALSHDPLRDYIAVLEKPFRLLNGNDIMTLERLVKDLKDLRGQFVAVIRKGGEQ